MDRRFLLFTLAAAMIMFVTVWKAAGPRPVAPIIAALPEPAPVPTAANSRGGSPVAVASAAATDTGPLPSGNVQLAGIPPVPATPLPDLPVLPGGGQPVCAVGESPDNGCGPPPTGFGNLGLLAARRY